MPYKNKEDERKYKEQWYEKNKEQIIEQKKQNYKIHKEEILKYIKQYQQSEKGKIACNGADIKYKQTLKGKIRNIKFNQSEKGKVIDIRYRQSEKGKITCKKQNFKHRQLGFIPINKFFNECEGHHISENFVIYIPKEIHKSINHNIWDWKNMEQINKIAIELL